MVSARIKEFYYITHIDNIPSILKYGILSHLKIEQEGMPYTPIYDKEIVSIRKKIMVDKDRSLWHFANIYFQARNPMLYRVLIEKSIEHIAVIAVKPNILNRQNIFISSGNAAHSSSIILPREKGLKILPEIRKIINLDWWAEQDGTKRKIMAECLVPDNISPELIMSIYVANREIADKLKQIVKWQDIEIIPEPAMFFEPVWKHDLTDNLSLIEGDMFFSRFHTLTISVNCVGIMGKGVASRAKYQFPDVYVGYQDLCRKRIMKMGKPHLYKRETSFDSQMADDPASLTAGNAETWFLLFPTKTHWRYKSNILGIEEGLQWIVDNYKKEGIKSLALPALGCGLGWLEWEDVGPLLCKYMSSLDIPVWIYLPLEKRIDNKFLTKEFLLPSN